MSQLSETDYPNIGHGHVRPRADGVKARCGGPGLCDICSREKCRLNNQLEAKRKQIRDMEERINAKVTITRQHVITYFASDYGGKGLDMEYLENAPDAILFRMAALAGETFEQWLREQRYESCNPRS